MLYQSGLQNKNVQILPDETCLFRPVITWSDSIKNKFENFVKALGILKHIFVIIECGTNKEEKWNIEFVD